MADEEPNYKWIGTWPQDLADGRMLGMGETVFLSDEAIKDNKELMDDGNLIKLTDKPAKATATPVKVGGE